jgi:hypothetical protein
MFRRILLGVVALFVCLVGIAQFRPKEPTKYGLTESERVMVFKSLVAQLNEINRVSAAILDEDQRAASVEVASFGVRRELAKKWGITPGQVAEIREEGTAAAWWSR